jgi:hypothetical protein
MRRGCLLALDRNNKDEARQAFVTAQRKQYYEGILPLRRSNLCGTLNRRISLAAKG